jgi:glyoxylase-like metal-dependent hydrolase (beta-lactamase superfamily II)
VQPKNLFLFLSLFFLSFPLFAQGDFDQVEIKTVPVADGIYMLEGAGGNIGVCVGEDGVFLIDDQFAPLTDKIKKAVAKLSDKPISFVLNTHWHGDHVGGNENLGNDGAVIIAHDNVYRRMSTEQVNKLLGNTTPAAPRSALPVVTYENSVTLRLNGQTIHAMHVPPAHTDGDSIVHFQEANVIHLGDILFNGMYPFIDIASGGSVNGYIEALEMAIEHSDDKTKIIPGHGPLATRAELKEAVKMIKSIRDRVAKAIEEGMSMEETLASAPSAEFDEEWAWEFISAERLVTILYMGLSDS